MKEDIYDLAVIGSGPGGYVAAVHAAHKGLRTICIDKRPAFGGTCLNVGCIPSKTLLQATEHYFWLTHSAKQEGVECKESAFDLAQAMQRKEHVVAGLTEGIAKLFQRSKVEGICGKARLVDAHTIEVVQEDTARHIRAEKILLATGSEPISLPFLPFDERQVLSSTGALALASVPKSMIVIGAGVIGVELASVYARLGCQITVVELLEKICPTLDEAIAKSFLQLLKRQKMDFRLGCKVTSGACDDKGVELQVAEVLSGKQFALSADVVLVAIGRKPYTSELNLEAVGIETTPQGVVVVDGSFATSVSNIFAVGDLIDGPMLAHKASSEAIACVENLLGNCQPLNYLSIPNVIYTHPEVAAVGATEQQAIDAGFDIMVGTAAFRGNARARCTGDLEGIVKVVGDAKSGVVLGVHIIGPQAAELIAAAMMAIESKASMAQLAFAPWAHPTLSEALKEAAMSALGIAIH